MRVADADMHSVTYMLSSSNSPKAHPARLFHQLGASPRPAGAPAAPARREQTGSSLRGGNCPAGSRGRREVAVRCAAVFINPSEQLASSTNTCIMRCSKPRHPQQTALTLCLR